MIPEPTMLDEDALADILAAHAYLIDGRCSCAPLRDGPRRAAREHARHQAAVIIRWGVRA